MHSIIIFNVIYFCTIYFELNKTHNIWNRCIFYSEKPIDLGDATDAKNAIYLQINYESFSFNILNKCIFLNT